MTKHKPLGKMNKQYRLRKAKHDPSYYTYNELVNEIGRLCKEQKKRG